MKNIFGKILGVVLLLSTLVVIFKLYSETVKEHKYTYSGVLTFRTIEALNVYVPYEVEYTVLGNNWLHDKYIDDITEDMNFHIRFSQINQLSEDSIIYLKLNDIYLDSTKLYESLKKSVYEDYIFFEPFEDISDNTIPSSTKITIKLKSHGELYFDDYIEERIDKMVQAKAELINAQMQLHQAEVKHFHLLKKQAEQELEITKRQLDKKHRAKLEKYNSK